MINKFVALLRSINVGGHNIIKMAEIKKEFEKMGFEKVSTYIQSGNVIFEVNDSESKDRSKLLEKIESQLSKKFNYKSRVILKTTSEIKKIVENFPEQFNDENFKNNVIFLSDKIDSKKVLENFSSNSEIEIIKYVKGALLWSVKLDKVKGSQFDKITSKKYFTQMTIRNVNTTMRILEILNKE